MDVAGNRVPSELAIASGTSGALPVWPWGVGPQWTSQAGVGSHWSNQAEIQLGTGTQGGPIGMGAYQGPIPGTWWPPYQAPSFAN